MSAKRKTAGRPKLERPTKKFTIPLFIDDMDNVKALPVEMTTFVREAIAEKLERAKWQDEDANQALFNSIDERLEVVTNG